MNELKVFSSTEFGELGVMLISGKEYFPATQCAELLGYKNPKDAILRHCKGVVKRDLPTNGGTQAVNYIPEGDLYRLIVSSKLPKAAEFERWVFDEVLPQIRHSGGYIGNAEELIAKTATAVVSEVIRQILPLIAQSDTAPQTVVYSQQDLSKYRRKATHKEGCIIEGIDKNLRQQVDEMLRSGDYSQKGIAEFLGDNGVQVSQMAVCYYARSRLGIVRRRRTVSLQIALDELKED